MITVDFNRGFKFLIFIWTAGVIFLQKTNAEKTSESLTNKISDSSYFFYQQSEYPRDCEEVHNQCPSSNSSGIYFIKPDGFQDPFEVVCNINTEIGWTIIQRRIFNGTVSFNRDWNSYKLGFGFLSHEFWIGNERLAYLTNQKAYQLSIVMTLSNGSEVSVSYSNFRIADEFSRYRLLSLTQYSGTTDNLSWCPINTVYDNCTICQRLCSDPSICQNTCTEGHSEGCICPGGFYMDDGGSCVLERGCDCYLPGERLLSEGETYINADCSRIAVCSNGQLTRNELYRCSSDAACEERNGERNCYCNEGFSGDGVICNSTRRTPTDCLDVYNDVSTSSGTYTIKPTNWPGDPFSVYCNMSDGGGWTVFQRRIDGSVDFYLEWQDYKDGFGDISREHWLGNDKLHYLTNQKRYKIRIDLVNRDHDQYYGAYDFFRIDNENALYTLSELGTYSGNSGSDYYLLGASRNQPFSTKDSDNDDYANYNIADNYYTAWWYGARGYFTLNGRYSDSLYIDNLPGSNYLYFSEMKLRPV